MQKSKRKIVVVEDDHDDEEEKDDKTKQLKRTRKCKKCKVTTIQYDERMNVCDICYIKQKQIEQDKAEEEEWKQEDSQIITRVWIYLPTTYISSLECIKITVQNDQVIPSFDSLQDVRRHWAKEIKLLDVLNVATDDTLLEKVVEEKWTKEESDAPRFHVVIRRKHDDHNNVNNKSTTLYIRIPEMDKHIYDSTYEEGDELKFATTLPQARRSWWEDFGSQNKIPFRVSQSQIEMNVISDDDILNYIQELNEEDRPRFARIVLS